LFLNFFIFNNINVFFLKKIKIKKNTSNVSTFIQKLKLHNLHKNKNAGHNINLLKVCIKWEKY